jgi:hypothetical protein
MQDFNFRKETQGVGEPDYTGLFFQDGPRTIKNRIRDVGE